MSNHTKSRRSSPNRKNRRMQSLVEPAIAELRAGKGIPFEQLMRNMAKEFGWDYDSFMAEAQAMARTELRARQAVESSK